jgi:peptide-methionine (S)-S-oxide reductase
LRLKPFCFLVSLTTWDRTARGSVKNHPSVDGVMSDERATATFGGGCFWCLESVYQELEGVEKVVSGYAGGHKPDPSYEEVCSGTTGHAEVVQVTYDPQVTTYRDLLEVFFTIHDPTTVDRQGADVGSQYRSIVLYNNDRERSLAEAMIRELEELDVFKDPIVTQVAPLKVFYPAEEHHQDFFRRNPRQPYCQAVVAPKLAKFRQRWSKRLKTASG